MRASVPPLQFAEEPGCQKAVEKVDRVISKTASVFNIGHLSIPQRIANYEIIEKLGSGGMGCVYLARHTRLDRMVAVKVLNPQQSESKEVLLRFQREMKAIGKLDHPNIVRALDADTDNEHHFLVMDYVRGVDLSKVALRAGKIPIPDACELIRQAALGLHHAHQRGLIHRDVKPSNIMLAEDAAGGVQVKILDLGLAQFDGQTSITNLTITGQMMGTLEYMAPEQGANSRMVTEQADIYSLGCTFYELLCGEPPFSAGRYNTPLALLSAIATEDLLPAAEKCGVSQELGTLIDGMLARDPADRPSSCADIAAKLESFSADGDLAALLKRVESSTSENKKTSPGAQRVPYSETMRLGNATTDRGIIYEQEPQADQSHFFKLKFLLILCCMSLLLFGVILLLPTKHGFVRIEILDPSIEVTIDGDEKYLVSGKETSFEVTPGKHSLRLRSAGIEFNTSQFIVTRKNTTALRVSLLPGNKLRVLNGDDVLDEYQIPMPQKPFAAIQKTPSQAIVPTLASRADGSQTISERNRILADRLLEDGQRILHVEVPGKTYSLRGNNLPKENPFRVTYIQTRPHSPISEEEFELLLNSRLIDLEVIRFTEQNPPADWLERLHQVYPELLQLYGFYSLPEYFEPIDRFKKLTQHVLYGISDEEAVRWTEMLLSKPDLTFIHYSKCKINQDVFDVLAKSQNMETLAFMNVSFGDEGLKAIRKIHSLKTLRLIIHRGKFSREGVMALAGHPNLVEIMVKNGHPAQLDDLKDLLKTLPGCVLITENLGIQKRYSHQDIVN